jgi:fatty acid desaturase
MDTLELFNLDNSDSPKETNLVAQARAVVGDLFEPKAEIFWLDLLISAGLGWGSVIIAYLAVPFSWQMFMGIILAGLTLYRALIFIHELTHLKANALPGFLSTWNLLVGLPLLLPSFTYIGVHADHHRLSSYGTAKDPEYMPFAGKKTAIIFFVAHSILLPALLALRFLVLSPFALLFPPLHRFLEIHASSLSMNLAYCRKVSQAERGNMILLELLILALWAIPIGLAVSGLLAWRIFALWYGVMAVIMVINSLRTLAAHRYRSHGEPMKLDGQLLDSVDVPGAMWTVIWAPVGLRYHALHHYFPSLPYHNLAIAHQRLIATLPPESSYRSSLSSSLGNSLSSLWNSQPTAN